MTHLKKRRGFTIVELLIVLVIIAIISAIMLVSYTAAQARSKSASAQSLANQVARKSEGWYSVLGGYPTYTQLSTSKINVGDATPTSPVESRLDDPANTILDGASANPTNEKKVGYRACTTGAQVEYYDAITKTVKYIGVGGASSTAACT
jgi:prepilin-type N-terminal cleavage/methylation domain-containing protein